MKLTGRIGNPPTDYSDKTFEFETVMESRRDIEVNFQEKTAAMRDLNRDISGLNAELFRIKSCKKLEKNAKNTQKR